MIDVGFWEVAMIGVLALIILGPERLPGVARTAGTWMGKARRMMRDIKTDLKSELDESELNELKNIRDDIQQAGNTFKSEVEAGEDKLRSEGSSMDNAIADALNKPAPGSKPTTSGDDALNKKTTTPKKAGSKKVAKKKTTKKKTGKKRTSRKKVAKKAPAKKSATKISATEPTTQEPA